MNASHAHSWHEDVSSCEPFKPSTSCFIGWKEMYCLAIGKMTSLCSNHVLLVATLTKHNNQIINRIKPISTNSTVIKGVLQKLKSENNVKFAFIGNTVVKRTRKLQNVGCIAPVITCVHILMFIFVCFCKSMQQTP